MDSPYLIGKHATGTFGYFQGGAVRRLSLTEVVWLEAKKVPVVQLSAGDARHAAAVSKTLFGI